MIALACIALGLAATSVAGLIVFAVKASSAKDEQLRARDLLDKTREEMRVVRGELDTETAAHVVTSKRLTVEQDLRASVETQRNDAYRRARDYYAARLKAANVADAVRIVDSLFSMPLPGVVPDEAVPAGDPARTDDDLLKP